jgi:DNA topoisomerase-1
MPDKLVIVESPAKAKTIGKYLGAGYRVLASVGHVRDLPEGNESIDVEHDFAPTYVIMPDKEQVVSQLRTSARAASAVYMATDPDREGEAIAWHIVQAINIPKKTPIHRVTFTEITPNAVKQAIERPRDIDMSLVDAQQARRILDRLVGYRLSRVLWKRVRRGLSAGRVQSVAVRLVVEREREIQAFVPQEYWSIEADLLQPRSVLVSLKLQGASSTNLILRMLATPTKSWQI